MNSPWLVNDVKKCIFQVLKFLVALDILKLISDYFYSPAVEYLIIIFCIHACANSAPECTVANLCRHNLLAVQAIPS